MIHPLHLKTKITDDPAEAGRILKEGGVVVFPTETVYGIGASSLLTKSCERIYDIKNRPKDNPLIVHFHNIESTYEYVHIDEKYKELMREYSPGPITYILEKKKEIYSSNLNTVGVRIPTQKVCIEMLKIAGPVSAPSANLSGKPSITSFEDACDVFDGKVDCILKGSPSEYGIESTILDLFSNPPRILRPGIISEKEVKKFIPNLASIFSSDRLEIIAPGLKYRHYSPNCEVKIIKTPLFQAFQQNSAFIGFEKIKELEFTKIVRDNREYMQELYSFFIQCDKKNIHIAYCQYPLDDNYTDGILNRLMKAEMKK